MFPFQNYDMLYDSRYKKEKNNVNSGANDIAQNKLSTQEEVATHILKKLLA